MLSQFSVQNGMCSRVSLTLLSLLLFSCGPSDEEKKRNAEIERGIHWVLVAKKPLEVLGKLGAQIENGIGFSIMCRAYRAEVGNINYFIKEFLASTHSEFDPRFNTSLLIIKDLHKDASVLWDCNDPEWSLDQARVDANSIDVHHKNIWNALNRNGLTKFKSEGGVRFFRKTNWQQYDLKLAINILWKRASERYLVLTSDIKKAELLFNKMK